MKIRVGTVFSGIGAFEFALKRLNIDHDIVFACDNGEIDIELENVEDVKKEVFSFDSSFEKKIFIDNLYTSKTHKTNFVKKSYLANYDCL